MQEHFSHLPIPLFLYMYLILTKAKEVKKMIAPRSFKGGEQEAFKKKENNSVKEGT